MSWARVCASLRVSTDMAPMLPYGCGAVQWGSRRADGGRGGGPGVRVGTVGATGGGPLPARGGTLPARGGTRLRAGPVGVSLGAGGLLGDALVVPDDLGDR